MRLTMQGSMRLTSISSRSRIAHLYPEPGDPPLLTKEGDLLSSPISSLFPISPLATSIAISPEHIKTGNSVVCAKISPSHSSPSLLGVLVDTTLRRNIRLASIALKSDKTVLPYLDDDIAEAILN